MQTYDLILTFTTDGRISEDESKLMAEALSVYHSNLLKRTPSAITELDKRSPKHIKITIQPFLPIVELPEEILLRIFSFLSWEEVNNSISLVCKYFNRLARSSDLWKQFFIREFSFTNIPTNKLIDWRLSFQNQHTSQQGELFLCSWCGHDLLSDLCSALQNNSNSAVPLFCKNCDWQFEDEVEWCQSCKHSPAINGFNVCEFCESTVCNPCFSTCADCNDCFACKACMTECKNCGLLCSSCVEERTLNQLFCPKCNIFLKNCDNVTPSH